jgi:agmatinase
MQANRPNEPAYGGIPTFSKLPLVLDPADLAGVDVAIVGAPIDETVSNRPGSRYGPRAIRAADDSAGVPPSRPHMWLGVDPFAELSVVDYGDAETVPGNAAESHAQVRRRVSEICAAGAIPIVLGGDHSIAHPNMAAVAEHRGKGAVGVIHFDAHADTAADLRGVVRSHGTPMRLVVDEGWVRGDRFIQVGLRGWWPNPDEFAWMRKVGFHWYTMYELDERGFDVCLSEVIRSAAEWGQPVFLSIDIDALDPAYAPGTGTPEVGGLTMRELLRAVRRITAELPIAGVEVVEVAPAYDPSGITAVNAHRLVIETLSGLALARSGREPQPEHDGRPHV